ncbi:hypothetical protein NDU88_007246 [Pleurodeles waltl]|uniref:Uncharacterized protein n=1 Tax=Pleurodeles waltl TaxID=8319 RepID=A0AAV7RQC6_PLEWA|nr:hypothetical protein NDU88_007246 [Pleurodeles waltl]
MHASDEPSYLQQANQELDEKRDALQHANQELDEMRDALETAYRRSLDLELKWKNASDMGLPDGKKGQ